MLISNSNQKKRPTFTLICLTGFLLNACTIATGSKSQYFSSQNIPNLSMPPAPLPAPNIGDKYYFANGWREQVINTNGETYDLINKQKRKVVNFRNFTIPSPYIEGKTAEYFKESRVATNALWPLDVGKSVKFTTEGRSVSKLSDRTTPFSQAWSCEVEGTERVRVLAGEFDTYRVSCRRYSSRNKWWQTYTWYYAPELGTYVMRRSFHKKRGESVRELTALRPTLKHEPKSVRTGIIRTWQNALENTKSGERKNWTDQKTGTSVEVIPLVTYRAKNGLFCRTYKQYLTRNNTPRLYAGVACRTGELKWRTPQTG